MTKDLTALFRTLSSSALRKIMCHRDIKLHRMAAYGILMNRRKGQKG